MYGNLLFCTHDDGSFHPLHPYPWETWIEGDVLLRLGPEFRDKESPDILDFGESCRYLICEHLPMHDAYALVRVP